MKCTSCGGEISDGEKFCGDCGTPVLSMPAPLPPPAPADDAPTHPAAGSGGGDQAEVPWDATATVPRTAEPTMPPPPPPPGYAPGPPPHTGPSPEMERLRALVAPAFRWDWAGSARVALTLLGTSLLLAIAVGAALRPDLDQGEWTFQSNVSYFTWLWTSIFGADMVASVDFDGGGAESSQGLWPLTLTVLTFAAGIWMFRRAAAGVRNPLSMLGFVFRTALLTAVPLTIITWFAGSDLDDIATLTDASDDDITEAEYWADSVSLGPSSAGTLGMTLLTVMVVLCLAALLKNDVLTGRAEQVRAWLAAPVAGAGILLVLLIPAGAIGELAVWLFWETPRGFGGDDVTGRDKVSIVAAAVAYAGNSGAAMLSLGSLGQLGAEIGLSPGDFEKGTSKGLTWLADSQGDWRGNDGLMVAWGLAPLVLITVAWWITRRAPRPGRALASWLASLLIVLPVTFHLASLHAQVDVDGVHEGLQAGLKASEDYEFTDEEWEEFDAEVSDELTDTLEDEFGSAGARAGREVFEDGLPDEAGARARVGIPLSSMWLVWLYAALISVGFAFLTGALSGERLRRFGSAISAASTGQPAPNAVGTGATYQIGDVVNGHVWTGQSWQPVDQPPPSPQTYQVGDVVNGHVWTGQEWQPVGDDPQ